MSTAGPEHAEPVRHPDESTDGLLNPSVEPAIAQTLGARLREERERRGWSREDIASRLKWQASLVRRIEDEDYSGIAHAVYLRGYLVSYTRLLGLPVKLADDIVGRHGRETPALVATGTVSRSRYLLDRYSVSATYLILTGLVIGPAVWLATHGGLEQNLARTVVLDSAPVTSAAPAPGATSGRDPLAATQTDELALPVPAAAPLIREPAPIVASMAPFASVSSTSVQAPPVAETPAHSLSLRLREASWVEVTAASGEKLEYGLLAAGTERHYSSDGAVTLRIGNAEGAEVVVDGERVELAPFRRANVAHIKLFADGIRASRVD